MGGDLVYGEHTTILQGKVISGACSFDIDGMISGGNEKRRKSRQSSTPSSVTQDFRSGADSVLIAIHLADMNNISIVIESGFSSTDAWTKCLEPNIPP